MSAAHADLGAELKAAPVAGDADLATEIELVDVVARVGCNNLHNFPPQRVWPVRLLLQANEVGSREVIFCSAQPGEGMNAHCQCPLQDLTENILLNG